MSLLRVVKDAVDLGKLDYFVQGGCGKRLAGYGGGSEQRGPF